MFYLHSAQASQSLLLTSLCLFMLHAYSLLVLASSALSLHSLLYLSVSFSHFNLRLVFTLGRQMLQGATMQQLQQVQVQSQGTPITVNAYPTCSSFTTN